MKGPRFEDVFKQSDVIDSREYVELSERREFGTSRVILRCPFCGRRVVAYIWSMAGGGKRCECGAIFGSLGQAHHWKAYQEDQV